MWPNELARSFGYGLPAGLADDANNIESLHWGSPIALNVLQSFAYSPGHRAHLFGEGWFGNAVEIGVGRAAPSNYWTVHTAFEEADDVFVTGVVFDDLDGDGRLDPGEGLPGVAVEVGPASVVLRGNGAIARTDAGGAWTLQVDPGRHFVRVGDGDGFDGPSWATVRVTQWNVGLDFMSGHRRPVVREYALCAGLEPTILGTGGDDVIVGTDGWDVIHGLGGDDVIDGLDGRDVICGGTGDDVIKGRGGRDTLYGQYGADLLIGGGNTDIVNGGIGVDECITGETVKACESAS
jgi:Ca2+-binding RTX toxin-like protein